MTRLSSQDTTDEQFAVVYECPDCEQRFLDQRRCPDCQLFCRRIGHGGECPHCDEPVAINDLAQTSDQEEVSGLAR